MHPLHVPTFTEQLVEFFVGLGDVFLIWVYTIGFLALFGLCCRGGMSPAKPVNEKHK